MFLPKRINVRNDTLDNIQGFIILNMFDKFIYVDDLKNIPKEYIKISYKVMGPYIRIFNNQLVFFKTKDLTNIGSQFKTTKNGRKVCFVKDIEIYDFLILY